jgi:hypothetical protein
MTIVGVIIGVPFIGVFGIFGSILVSGIGSFLKTREQISTKKEKL